MSASFVLICKNMFVKLDDMSCVIHTDSKMQKSFSCVCAKKVLLICKWLNSDAYCPYIQDRISLQLIVT